MKFEGFDWDLGNIKKCQKHGLVIREIECFFLQKQIYTSLDVKHSVLEYRFLAVGKGPKGKLMIVAFTVRNIGNKKLIRLISARYMNKKEVRKYEEIFEEN